MPFVPRAGAIVGGYALHEELGRGGFGAVWRASGTDGRPVAVKLLTSLADAASRRRFEREAGVLAALRHRNSVLLLGSGEVDETAFLVMELVVGQSLDAWRARPRPIAEIADVATQIADVLTYAHRQGIVHRDLKPANVIIDSNGVVKVLDFGIAKLVDAPLVDLTKTGEMIGTPGFMSPEQLRGSREIGPATDQYALGVVLFELVTGRHPFDGANPMTLGMAHLREPIPPVPDAGHLGPIIARLLAKDPHDRFASMQAVADALAGRCSAQPGTVGPAPTARGRRGVAVGLVVAVAVAVGAVALLAMRRGDPEPPPLPQPVVARTAPVGLVKGAEPAPASTPEPVVAEGPCSHLGEGLRERIIDPQDGRRALSYVPPAFDPSANPWLIVGLEPAAPMGSDAFFRVAGLPDIADKHNAVVLIPDPKRGAELGRSWFSWLAPLGIWTDQPVRNAVEDILLAQEAFCLDDAPVFLFGHGVGARAADWIAREAPAVVDAVVVSQHRYADAADRPRLEAFAPVTAVPYLNIVAARSPYRPLEGGTCPASPGKLFAWPLDEQRSHWLGPHGCSGSRRVAARHPQGTCYIWPCAVAYEECHVEASEVLPGITEPEGGPGCEGSLAPDFPYLQVVAEFFARHAPREEGGLKP